MIAYVPPERYRDRHRCKPRAGGPRVGEWGLYKKYGAVYNLENNTSRPATVREVSLYEQGLIPHIDEALEQEVVLV